MAITGNTIKELKNLMEYCDNLECEECPFHNSINDSCLLKLFPFQYDIKEITQRFFDNAIMQ